MSTGLHVAPTCLRVTAHFLCQVKLSHSTQSGFYPTIAFLCAFKSLATEQAVILLWCKAHQDKTERWELALRALVSCSSSTSLSPGITGADSAEEDPNTCGMNNLSVGEAFSLVTLISSHLLPLNIILPRLPAFFIYFFFPSAVGCSPSRLGAGVSRWHCDIHSSSFLFCSAHEQSFEFFH